MAKVPVPGTIVKHRALDEDLSTTIANALFKKAASLIEYLNQSQPIGKVIWFHATQDLLPEMPDPKYWKELDGTAVVNANSPLNGWVTPNLSEVFLKHPNGLETLQVLTGSNSRALSHNHGGATGFTFDAGEFAVDTGPLLSPFYHNHSIANAGASGDIQPPYRDLRFFMRIA